MQKSHEIELPHSLMIAIIKAKQGKTNLVTNTCGQGCRGRQKNRAGGNIKMIWLLWRHYSSLL